MPIPHWLLGFAVAKLVEGGIWPELPYDLAVKINDASTGRHDLVVTREDLDSMDDETWHAIARMLP